MTRFRLNIPPHVARVIHSFDPDLIQLLRSAIRAIAATPERGTLLQLELAGLYEYRVRQFCLVYSVTQRTRMIKLMAVSHRHYRHEGLTERLNRAIH